MGLNKKKLLKICRLYIKRFQFQMAIKNYHQLIYKLKYVVEYT